MTIKQLSLEDYQPPASPAREGELAHIYDPELDGVVKQGETLSIYADGTRELVKTESLDPPPVKASKILDDTWSEGGQIYFLDGAAWGVSEDLTTICLGPAELIYSALITGSMIKSRNPAINQIIEMERRIINAKRDGEPRAAKASGRAQKPVRASNKRVRFGSTVRYKHPNVRRPTAKPRAPDDIP